MSDSSNTSVVPLRIWNTFIDDRKESCYGRKIPKKS